MFKMLGMIVLTSAETITYAVLWMTMTYLTNVWKISFTYAAAIINMWSGASAMLGLALSHLADAFVGNFTVVLTSFLSYCVGVGLLALSTPPVLAKYTGTCSDYTPECVGHEHKLLFYIGLGLIAVGAAGHTTPMGAFARDQFTEEDLENGGVDEEDDCNMRFCALSCCSCFVILLPIVAMAGIIVIPYVKPWSVRYEIAAIFSLAETLIFLCGSCWYNYVGPQGSPLTTIARVFVAASSKLFCRRPKDVDQLYQRSDSNDELPHTNVLCYLDKAAIILTSKTKEQQEKNRWRLCTVTEVERTKVFLRMIPMWLTFFVCGLVSSIGNTYFLEQANHMNDKVGHHKVPLTTFLLIYLMVRGTFPKLYSLYSILRNIIEDDEESNPSRYTPPPPIGMAVSMVFTILCCITAAKVEGRRLHVVASHGLIDKPDERIPMSIFWVVPQFMLLGVADGMYDKSVECLILNSVGQVLGQVGLYMACFKNLVFGGGIMGSTLLVYVVGRISERGGRMNWFQSTINKSRLDNYYWVLAALSAVNLVVCIVVAWSYGYMESRSEGNEAPKYEDTDGV